MIRSPRLPSRRLTVGVTLTLLVLTASPLRSETMLTYFGTYTRGDSGSEGIYVAEFDSATGKLGALKLAAEAVNPSFLALHPDAPYLYAVSEVAGSDGKPGGAVHAYRIDLVDGTLTLLNSQSSGGAGPCHISVDATGRCVLVANYGGGSCASLGIEPDGSLRPARSVIQHEGSSVNERRQEGPHAHSANPGPGNRFAFVADLGIDKVNIYRLDPDAATLEPAGFAAVAPGAGPRHFAFHPDGRWAYVINELSLTVTGFAFDPNQGTLTEIQTISTVPDGIDRNGISTAEVQVHPSGKFLYGSNRGHDTIAAYRIDAASGELELVEIEPILGETPRNFGIDPSGSFLLAAGQKSSTVHVFRINPDSGELSPTGDSIEVGAPVCVKFYPLSEDR